MRLHLTRRPVRSIAAQRRGIQPTRGMTRLSAPAEIPFREETT